MRSVLESRAVARSVPGGAVGAAEYTLNLTECSSDTNIIGLLNNGKKSYHLQEFEPGQVD